MPRGHATAQTLPWPALILLSVIFNLGPHLLCSARQKEEFFVAQIRAHSVCVGNSSNMSPLPYSQYWNATFPSAPISDYQESLNKLLLQRLPLARLLSRPGLCHFPEIPALESNSWETFPALLSRTLSVSLPLCLCLSACLSLSPSLLPFLT